MNKHLRLKEPCVYVLTYIKCCLKKRVTFASHRELIDFAEKNNICTYQAEKFYTE